MKTLEFCKIATKGGATTGHTKPVKGSIGNELWSSYCMLLLLLVGAVSAVAEPLPQFDRVRVLETPRAIQDFALTDQDGNAFTLDGLHGKVTLVFFGFTNCPDVCPAVMGKFRLLARSGLLDPERVAYVLVSVDGERDTPPVLKKFLSIYSPDFIGLTGNPSDVKKLARAFSASFFKDNGNGADGNYSVAHSPQSFLLDAKGNLRAEMYDPSIEVMAGIGNAVLAESVE